MSKQEKVLRDIMTKDLNKTSKVKGTNDWTKMELSDFIRGNEV
jgi:hypothetical protein